MIDIKEDEWLTLVAAYREWRRFAPARESHSLYILPMPGKMQMSLGLIPSAPRSLLDISERVRFLRFDEGLRFKRCLDWLREYGILDKTYRRKADARSIYDVAIEATTAILGEMKFNITQVEDPEILYLSTINFFEAFTFLFLPVETIDQTRSAPVNLGANSIHFDYTAWTSSQPSSYVDPNMILNRLDWAVLVDILSVDEEEVFGWLKTRKDRGIIAVERLPYVEGRNSIVDEAFEYATQTTAPASREFVVARAHLTSKGKQSLQRLWQERTGYNSKNVTIKINQLKELVMGDKYTAGQVGAMGPGAVAHNMTFNQTWKALESKIDIATLASDLEKLRMALKQKASQPEHEVAVGTVASAELEAKKGNGAKALEYLGKAGKWTLDVAKEIGTKVAVEAIKSALGLQKAGG